MPILSEEKRNRARNERVGRAVHENQRSTNGQTVIAAQTAQHCREQL